MQIKKVISKASCVFFCAVYPFSGVISAPGTGHPVNTPVPETEWKNNMIGITKKVPPPWTNIEVSDKKIKCLGREYIFNNGIFPEIIIGKDNILEKPIHFVVKNGNALYASESERFSFKSIEPEKVICSVENDNKLFSLNAQVTIEYDGMIRIDWNIIPKQDTPVTLLQLEIPIKKEFGKYLLYTAGGARISKADLTPPEWHSTFKPSVWLGNEDKGLCWFAETDQGWIATKDKSQKINIVRDDKGNVILSVNYINSVEPVTLRKKGFSATFGLLPTPPKPLPENFESIRPYLQNNSRLAVAWPSPSFVQWHNHPAIKDQNVLDKMIASYKAKGCDRILLWVSPNKASGALPEFLSHKEEWEIPGIFENTPFAKAMGAPLLGACPQNKDWSDYIMYAIKKYAIDGEPDICGLYQDFGCINGCTNMKHGCGYKDGDEIVETYPIFATREIRKRIYTLFKENRKNAFLLHHQSGMLIPPIMSFYDAYLDGETYNGIIGQNPHYMDFLSLETFRTEYTGRQFGVIPYFIPQLGGRDDVPDNSKASKYTDELLAITLQHQSMIFPLNSKMCNIEALNKVWKIKDEFNIEDAEFFPYWRQDIVTSWNKSIKISFYKKENRALLVISNFCDDDILANVKIDPAKLGFKSGKIEAEDKLTNKELKIVDNLFNVPVGRRNFTLVNLN